MANGLKGAVRSCLRKALFLVTAAAISAPAVASTAESRKSKSQEGFKFNQQDPIVITSDRMEADRKKNFIVYSGSVVATQGEITMRSNTLTAHFTPEMNRFKEIIAEGNVHITQGDRVATGRRAIFNDQKQTITLTGNAMIRQGNSEVTGPRIIFFIEQDRAVAESSEQQKERIKATIFPSELRDSKGESQPVKQP